MNGIILQNILIFLGISLLTVPISKRLGIGSVLGYLLGGIIIGPFALGWIGKEGEEIMHIAEFGVVIMLFVIGLELSPNSFWKMRKTILGMGVFQMFLTSVLFFGVFYLFFLFSWQVSIALALSLSMSSTAIVLQTLKEKNLSKTEAGISSFSILLFQDIAVVPILSIIPLLAINPGLIVHHDDASSWINSLSAPFSALVMIGAVTLIFVVGRFIVNPLLHWVARAHMRELFTATALFLVIGAALLMEKVGISAALGTFFAGVLLANSEFRHELETDIEPFKGILLGLFFTAVGSTINFGLILNENYKILLFVLVLMVIKSIVLLTIGKLFKLRLSQNVLNALLLSQVGEFAFVLLTSIYSFQLIDRETSDFIVASIALSMLFSPIFLFIYDKIQSNRLELNQTENSKVSEEIETQNEVIIAGFGHFGSTLGRFLKANDVSATILDHDIDRVTLLRKMGFKVYFGDATRLDLLEKAGISEAKIFISTLDSPEKNAELVDNINRHYPHINLFIRSKNRYDAYELIDKSVSNVYRESLHTSVQMGVDVLGTLGHRKYTVTRKATAFIKYDEESLVKLAKNRNHEESYIESVREEIMIQEKLLNEDLQFSNLNSDIAWNSLKRNEKL